MEEKGWWRTFFVIVFVNKINTDLCRFFVCLSSTLIYLIYSSRQMFSAHTRLPETKLLLWVWYIRQADFVRLLYVRGYMLVFKSIIAGLNVQLCCRDTYSTERYLHHAGHPWTASTCNHALHPHHGATVSQRHRLITAHLKGSIIQKPVLICFPPMFWSTDEERTCYTGALCGLGWNSQTQEGILPERDIELSFDVKFDVEDITEVMAVTRETAVVWLTVVMK